MNSSDRRVPLDAGALWISTHGRRCVFGLLLALLTPCSHALPAQKTETTKGEKRAANRLSKETSPYLLLHAHNPVDWFPWGAEALEKARREDKPIFLSIGYSSCHWCHVMERESFMDDEIATFLNENFVCIKVDREERPEVDEIYITAVQVYYQLLGSSRNGGWPLSAFLTPEAQPFFGGSYFPPRDSERGTGFLTVIRRVAEVWKESPDRVREGGKQIADLVAQNLDRRSLAAELPDASVNSAAVQAALAEQFDPLHGGFGYSEADPQQPKFPEPSNLAFLLERARGGDGEALKMLNTTLHHMAEGGLRDHLGGGFHRYSTDRRWQVPHFEKMLYDNAQLASVFVEAHAFTGNPTYRDAAEETLAFIAREMTSPEGAFFSALDAQAGGVEGATYLWERDEAKRLLAEDEWKLVSAAYGLAGEPNFDGRYLPMLARPLGELAVELGASTDELRTRLTPIRAKLLTARQSREQPACDTKVIAAWNGLMIGAYADAGRVLQHEPYLRTAERAAEFVLTKLRTPDGRLWHVYAGGAAKLNAYLDDYAYMVSGLLSLHRATGEQRWLQAADELTARQLELFWDDKRGGFFFTSHDHETLLARSKNSVDGVLPAANAVTAKNLIALSQRLDRPAYLERAERTLRAFAGYLRELPAAMPQTALALDALESARAGGSKDLR